MYLITLFYCLSLRPQVARLSARVELSGETPISNRRNYSGGRRQALSADVLIPAMWTDTRFSERSSLAAYGENIRVSPRRGKMCMYRTRAIHAPYEEGRNAIWRYSSIISPFFLNAGFIVSAL